MQAYSWFLRAISCILVVYVIYWAATWSSPTYDDIRALAIGSGFEGNPKLPNEEFKKRYDKGEQLLERRVSEATSLRWWNQATDWISFLVTSIIALIAGLTGRPLPVEQAEKASAAKKTPEKPESPAAKPAGGLIRASKSLVGIMGLLAAVASVLTATSSKLASSAELRKGEAIELQTVLSSARRDWLKAQTADEAQLILQKVDEELVKRQ